MENLETYLNKIGAIVGEPVALHVGNRDGTFTKLTKTPAELDQLQIGSYLFHKFTGVIAGANGPIIQYLVKTLSPNEYTIAQFRLTQFTGCCAFMFSTSTAVSAKWQNKGIGTILMGLKQYISKAANFSALVVTDKKSNLAEVGLLRKCGFRELYEKLNRRTGNTVIMWIKEW